MAARLFRFTALEISKGSVMSNPVIEAKIERVVEATEALTNAVVTLREKADDDRTAALVDVTDAREEYKTALREFLQPTLRVASAA